MTVTCQEITDQLMSYAAGMLDADEATPVRQHLASGCPQCAGRLAEAEATLGLLVLTLDPQNPSAQAKSQLMNRVASRQVSPSMRLIPAPPSWWQQLALSSAMAAAVAAAITIFFVTRLKPSPVIAPAPSNDLSRTVAMMAGVLENQHEEMESLRASKQPQTVEWASGPHLKTIVLSAMSNQPTTAHGRVWWDTDRNSWHFFADGLTPPPTGKTYELWFVSADGKMKLPAGGLNVDAAGDAELLAKVPRSIAGQLDIAAVTDEPAKGEITAPTGSFQLMGSLQ